MICYLLLIFTFVYSTFCYECIKVCSCGMIYNLQTLKCIRKDLNEFPKNIDNHTQFIIFEKNNIKEIPRTISKTLPALQKIVLLYNKLERLHSRTFANLKQLEYVNLLRNHITSIGDNIFEGVDQSLKMDLILQGNNISIINKNAFQGLYADTRINLAENALERLHPDTFVDVRYLKTLTLSKNRFKSIPSGLFRNQGVLFFLKFDNNQIETIEENAFVGLHSLETLDLSANNLRALPDNIFKTNKALSSMNLESNNFNYPPTNLPSHVNITLKDNPILCDCDLKRMLSNHAYKLSLKDIDQVICTNDIKRTTVESLKELDCVTTTTENVTTLISNGNTTVAGGSINEVTSTPVTVAKKQKETKEKSWPIILGVILCVCVVLVVVFLFVYLYRRKIYEASTVTLSRRKNKNYRSTDAEEEFEYRDAEGWHGSCTAMMKKTEGNI